MKLICGVRKTCDHKNECIIHIEYIPILIFKLLRIDIKYTMDWNKDTVWKCCWRWLNLRRYFHFCPICENKPHDLSPPYFYPHFTIRHWKPNRQRFRAFFLTLATFTFWPYWPLYHFFASVISSVSDFYSLKRHHTALELLWQLYAAIMSWVWWCVELVVY